MVCYGIFWSCQLLSFSRSGVRIWNKIPLTLREQRKDAFKRNLDKLLMKVQFLPELLIQFSKVLSFLIPLGATFYIYIYIYLFHFIFSFSLLTFFCQLYRRQLFYCCPPRIAPLIVGNIDLNYLII